MISVVSIKPRDDDEVGEENVEFMGIFPMPSIGVDVNDIPSRKASVTKLDIFFICFSILTHIVDVGFDLNLAIRYLIDGEKVYFYWTIGFLFIPSFINIVVSLRMYNQDREVINTISIIIIIGLYVDSWNTSPAVIINSESMNWFKYMLDTHVFAS